MIRDEYRERYWMQHPIIGYVALDENDQPYQPILGTGWNSRKKPVTVYKSMERAAGYSPVNKATEVRMFQPIEKKS